SELDMLGIVNSVVISKGRYGRTREVNIEADLSSIKTVLDEDYRLKELKNYENELKRLVKLLV
ncbi:MAG: cell division control protein Cdc6, partial [Archaeoglobaceae archaeon]